MRKTTEEDRKVLREVVFMLADTEKAIREKYDDVFDDREVSEYISMALVNFIGNFIYQNSKDKTMRLINYENFITNLNNWINAIEKHSENH
jgi:hypothetical protein